MQDNSKTIPGDWEDDRSSNSLTTSFALGSTTSNKSEAKGKSYKLYTSRAQEMLRVHKHKEQEYADPISFDRDSIAEEHYSCLPPFTSSTSRRGRPSKAATGSVNAVTKLSNASPPVPIALGTAFPNSNLLENEDVGVSNTNVSVKKRVRDENALGAANDGTIGNDYQVKRLSIEQIHVAIGRFLYEIQAPLDAVKNSVYFQPMIDAIASGGKETVTPSYDDIRGWMLKNAVEEMKSEIKYV
ncbi:uncharacterized protein LOC125474552 [Pyrus x bretschneideri]|uniref:uncharacterized protein LOC125474552 n=1 Tax=Pyrus x bretschneideri TaxID=225117 RepID=UPI002030539D|nr:uncharacterized protein LOC125474552 [Pyrus x bretschneideri]